MADAICTLIPMKDPADQVSAFRQWFSQLLLKTSLFTLYLAYAELNRNVK